MGAFEAIALLLCLCNSGLRQPLLFPPTAHHWRGAGDFSGINRFSAR